MRHFSTPIYILLRCRKSLFLMSVFKNLKPLTLKHLPLQVLNLKPLTLKHLPLQVLNLHMSETHIYTNNGPLPLMDADEQYLVLQWLGLTAWCNILTCHNTPVTSDHQEGKGGMASGGDWISCMPVQPFKNGALLPSVQPWIDNANQTILHPGWLTRKIRRRMLTAQAENGGSRVNPNEPQEVMKYGYGTWMGWWSFRLDCRNSVPGPRWGRRQPSGWYKVKQQIVESSMVQLCAYINAGVLCPCSPHHSILCHSSGNL